jgi:hypothetical protein
VAQETPQALRHLKEMLAEITTTKPALGQLVAAVDLPA